MRFYRLDGSFCERHSDNEFGWYFQDITIDEAVPNFIEKNQKIKDDSQKKRKKCKIIRENFEENLPFLDNYGIVKTTKIDNFFRSINRDFLLDGDPESRNKNFNKELEAEIRDYHENQEKNLLSLMLEIRNTSIYRPKTIHVPNNDFSLKEIVKKKDYMGIPNRMDLLNSIGLGDEIDKSIENVIRQKSVMLQEIYVIKTFFEDTEKRIDVIFNEALALRNELTKVNYLDNLIHLLNGDIAKVKNFKIPFKCFKQPRSTNDKTNVKNNIINIIL